MIWAGATVAGWYQVVAIVVSVVIRDAGVIDALAEPEALLVFGGHRRGDVEGACERVGVSGAGTSSRYAVWAGEGDIVGTFNAIRVV
ncbi:MAG: hypothetical protein ACRDRA_13480 [Pseudonocardiaceae bacterium]